MDSNMQDGIKLVFYRIVGGLFVLMALGPLIKYWTDYAGTVEGNHFMGAISIVLLGLDFINFVIIAGMGIAVFYLYYSAVNKRKYGDEETQTYYNEEARYR